MTGRLAWILGLALLCAAPAAAQETVRVRSGEHAGFTRLVLYLPGEPSWRLGTSPSGYTFGTADRGLDYDLSQVWDFIPRTRLARLTQADGALSMSLACACHADAFEYRPGIVVVDIRDGPAAAASRFEAPYDRTARRPGAAGGTGSAGAATLFPSLTDRFFGPSPASAVAATPVPPLETLPDPDALRADMLGGLAAALSQGLLEPGERPRPDAGAPAATPPEPGTASAPPGRAPRPVTGVEAGRAALEVTTAFERAFRRDAPPLQTPGAECHAPGLYAFLPDAETTQAALWSQVSAARRAAFDAADRTSEAAARALAQAYLALGFGAEARAVLAEFGATGAEAQLLADLGSLMDAPADPGPAVAARLAPEAGCDTPGAPWGVLASGGRDLATPIAGDAVLRTVSALPIHLRRQIVPALSAALRDARLPELAAAVRKTVERVSEAPPAEFVLEAARARGAAVGLPSAPAPETGPDATAGGPGDPEAPSAADQVLAASSETGGDAASPEPGGVSAAPQAAPARPAAPQALSAAPGGRPAATGADLPAPDDTIAGLGAMADRLQRMARDPRLRDPAVMTEAAALLQGARGSPESVPLFDALVEALVAAGHHRETLALLDRLAASSAAPSYDLAGATRSVLSDLARRGPADALVLALAEHADRLAPDRLPEELRLAVAQRLLGLGLVSAARLYAPPPAPDADAAARLVQAEIALADGAPMEALARVATLDGPDAARLRAAALAAAGAHDEAARLLAAAGATAAAADAAWASGDWTLAASLQPDGARRALATRLAAGADDAGSADLAPSGAEDGAGAPAAPPADGALIAPGSAAGVAAGPAAGGAIPSAAPADAVAPPGPLAQRRALLDASAEIRALVAETLGGD